MLMDFDAVWNNIEHCEGQTFATSSGQPFVFDVQKNVLAIRRSDMVLNREDIAAAYRAGVSDKSSSGRGIVAYINAILRDNRYPKLICRVMKQRRAHVRGKSSLLALFRFHANTQSSTLSLLPQPV